MKKDASPVQKRYEDDMADLVDGWHKQDELDRIKEELQATRRLCLVFIISAALWAVVITQLVR